MEYLFSEKERPLPVFRFINFLLCLAVTAIVVIGGYWYVTTPQPAKLQDQVTFALDNAIFQVQRFKQGGDETVATWRDLARAGNSAAMLYQAKFLFAEAKNNPSAYNEALAVLDQLAKRGIPEGQNAYGVMIRDGLGGLQANKIEAYKWFNLAAVQGSKLAEENMLQLSHTMSSGEIYEAESRSSAWMLDYLAGKTEGVVIGR